jgi:ABC-type lipopolysaccharide export system ATPase subunit
MIERLLHGLDLEHIRHIQAANLNHAEKRLVHIAMAFCGGSKVSTYYYVLSYCHIYYYIILIKEQTTGSLLTPM